MDTSKKRCDMLHKECCKKNAKCDNLREENAELSKRCFELENAGAKDDE